MLSTEERARRNEIVRRSWAKQASKYDKSMSFFERRVFGEQHRAWAASRAYGQTLEVGIGTGLNLPLYPIDLELHGLDLSSEMVDLARIRAAAMDRSADIRVGDAHELPYASTSFDTVIATYTLCNVPDYARAIDEMKRVLRPGGRLILVDHIRSSILPIYCLQKVVEFFSLRLQSETQTRRPLEQVLNAGFVVVERDRMRAGVVERLVAIKLPANRSSDFIVGVGLVLDRTNECPFRGALLVATGILLLNGYWTRLFVPLMRLFAKTGWLPI